MEQDLNSKVVELLNYRLPNFHTSLSNDVSEVVNHHLLQANTHVIVIQHFTEKEALQETITQFQDQVKALQLQLNSMTLKVTSNQKSQSAIHANLLTVHKYHKKVVFKVFQAWKSRAFFKKNQHNKTNYSTNFYRRGIMRNIFKAWKQTAHMIFIRHVDKIAQNAVNAAEIQFRQNTSEEVSVLRNMVTELTEDLRAETVAKNNLKYIYDQAILRSMNALNIESINIQQSSVLKAQDMRDVTKQLFYTPDKLVGSFKSNPN